MEDINKNEELKEKSDEQKKQSEEVIPKHVDLDKSKSEEEDNKSLQDIKDDFNKLINTLESKEMLEKNQVKIFSKWNIFKHNIDSKFRKLTKASRTIRVMCKMDYTIYPIDLPIEGKTILFNGRRYKLDGYEHRLYEIQNIQCVFVDVNDARLLELSHKYTNPSYDAREFCSLFDSKAINDLMAGIETGEKLDKMYYIGLITLGVSGLAVAILMGWIEPDWQKIIHGIADIAKAAASAVQENTGAGSTGQTITGR